MESACYTGAMRAIRHHRFGGPEVLVLDTLPTPEPGPGEVRLAVHAAAINHYDILSRQGINPQLPLPRIVGIDCTGTVEVCNADRPDLRPGTPVVVLGERLGNGGPGAYASHVVVDAEEVFPVPAGLDLTQVACLGISYLTAWYALTGRSSPPPGSTLLIQGVGGGVASAALQIAVARGVRVIATTSSDDKCAAALRLGAFAAINYRAEDPVAGVRRLCDGVDTVLNAVGGDTVAQGLRCLRHGGQLLSIGSAYGREFRLDGFDFLCRELVLTGVNISFHTPEHRHELLLALCAEMAAGRLQVLIDREFPLEQAAAAQTYVAGHTHFGKVVLRP